MLQVALLVAVAEHLQLSGVTYLKTTGSCVGMMSLCDFAPLQGAPEAQGVAAATSSL